METRNSDYNGKLEVWRDLAWGAYIMAGNITQSGGVAKKVWQSTLEHVKNEDALVKNCLILGLGGGSIANIVNKNWPQASITGVEIDSQMVALGKKYLGLDTKKVEIICQDASEFIKSHKKKYDLVCVDMYVGTDVPGKFASQEFVEKAKSLVVPDGIIIFNRTYYDEKRKEALAFEKVLLASRFRVERFFPEANLMFICRFSG